MPRSPWHAAVQRTRVSCPGVRQEFPMQPNECVGAVLPTQLPNLVVNVLLAIARDINGVTPRCKASRSPAIQLTFDPAVCRAGQFWVWLQRHDGAENLLPGRLQTVVQSGGSVPV